MTPDNHHTTYYQENPCGNHVSPSKETLRFMKRHEQANKEAMQSMGELRDIVVEIRTDVKGIHTQTKKTNGRVNELESIVNEYKPMWEEQRVERLEDRKKVRYLLYKIVAVGAVLALLGTNVNTIIKMFL